MRSTMFDSSHSVDEDELLTTGEAAKVLNTSRQHIVDLCNSGRLPFATSGTHRRIRRGDLDALRMRTLRMSRDQRRSLWLAYAVAAQIVTDPSRSADVARRNLAKMRQTARGEALLWLDEWARLLDGPIDKLLDRLTARDVRGRELRQNSPFAGLLTQDERERVLAAWRSSEAQAK